MILHHLRSLVVCALALVMAGLFPSHAQTDAPVVAVASDLQFSAAEIAEAFTAETGLNVRLSVGSTGNLTRQIREGVPCELFMAADEQFITDLHAEGLTRDSGHLYAIGRLAIMVPQGSVLDADSQLDALEALLAEGRITRFAIANSEHAPYAVRAHEALMHRGLWEGLQPFLVLGDSVSRVAAFALSGNADGGIIAHSLALAPDVARRRSHVPIPKEWHSPLRQSMALLAGAGPVAEAFHAYVTGPAGRAISCSDMACRCHRSGH